MKFIGQPFSGLLWILVWLLLGSPPAWAFRLSTLNLNFSPSGAAAIQTVVADNDGTVPVTLQIELLRRDIDDDGKETGVSNQDFTLSPMHFTLAPGARHHIRLRWNGKVAVPRELAYRITVSEVPSAPSAPEPARKVGVNLVPQTQYVVSAYVTPPGAVAKVVVESFKILPDGKGELILNNLGTAHQLLKNLKVSIRRPIEGKPPEIYALDNDQLIDLRAENLLPGKARRFMLSLPKKLATYEGPVTAEVLLN